VNKWVPNKQKDLAKSDIFRFGYFNNVGKEGDKR